MNQSDHTGCGDSIGLDLGTTAMKGVRLTPAGKLAAACEVATSYNHPHPGFVEVDPAAHWLAVATLIRKLVAAAPGKVSAIAIAGASGNTLLADAQGQPLRPIINWMDQRTAGQPPAALSGLTPEEVRATAGWPCLDRFPLAHLGWLRQHEPATLERAARVAMNTDWLLFRLSGRWVMDYSTATTFHLQNQQARSWHQPYLQRLKLSDSRLSQLMPSGVAVGQITAAAAAATGLPGDAVAVSGSFDHPAAARAAGITEPGTLMLSCGTSWVGFLPWQERQQIIAAAMLCDPFLSDSGGPWAGMLSVSAIGTTINDYVAHVIAPGEANPLALFDELAAQAAPGAGGVVIDLRRPWQPLPGVSRTNVARAVMEGAARLLVDKLQQLRPFGFAFNKAVLVGGPGKSPIWPAIIAEITGLDLSVGPEHAGARGAALLAAAGLAAATANKP